MRARNDKEDFLRSIHSLKRQKRCRPLPRMADTSHIGWKTDPVRDDYGNGPSTAVASRDGLAAGGPGAKDGLIYD
jgi:hypothetical protein